MPNYQRVGGEVLDMAEEIRAKHHPDQEKAGVTTMFLFAYGKQNEAGEWTSYAITKNRVRCAGMAKVVALRERVAGLPDTIVLLDGDRWEEWTPKRRKSLIDHELTHFELQYLPDAPGVWKTDDHGRPVLKIRPHDFEVGWFESVARRWGVDSFEVDQATQLVTPSGQLIFPWAAKGPKPETMAESGDVVTNAFAALIAVGHTESQARIMIDRVSAGGAVFESVASLVDAVYSLQMNDAGPETLGIADAVSKASGKPKTKPKTKPKPEGGKKKSKAELEAEAEAKFNAKP